MLRITSLLFNSTAWVGITYSLIGGMPLCFFGATGPTLAFTRAIVAIANAVDVPFLTFNLWVSVWVVFYATLAAFLDVTRFIKLATRFTDEIFGFIIVSIFLRDAIGDPFSELGILRYFQPSLPFNVAMEKEPGFKYTESALLSTVLGFGTAALIFFFRSFKFSPYFCGDQSRSFLHDFAVPFSVAIATLINQYLFSDIATQRLNVPDHFEPTFKCCDATCNTYFPTDCPNQAAAFLPRSWFVKFGDLNGQNWVIVMAAGPAVLAFALVFLDSGITWHWMNQKTHKLRHGDAYDYDLLLNGAFNFFNGMMGLPWLVASTVPCLTHLNALAEKDREGHFICVQETRLTMLFSNILLALSLLVLPVLQLLPMAVLYGIFLYMASTALSTIQFYKRFMMLFQQPNKYASSPWTGHIENWRVHMYTAIQFFLFGLVFFVQNFPPITAGFPLMILLCIPVRLYILPRIYEGWELLLLDGEDEDIKAWQEKKEKVMKRMHALAITGRFEEIA